MSEENQLVWCCMSIIKAEDNKKWINFFVAVIAILSGFLVIRFLGQMGEWFDLEAKVPYFIGVSQGLGALIGLVVFLVVLVLIVELCINEYLYERLYKQRCFYLLDFQ